MTDLLLQQQTDNSAAIASKNLEKEKAQVRDLRRTLDEHKELLHFLREGMYNLISENGSAIPLEHMTQEQRRELAAFEQELGAITMALTPQTTARPLRMRRQII